MEFVEGAIPNQKTFGTIAFPKTLLPPSDLPNDTCTTEMLSNMVRENRERLREALDRHSAVLFRGFRVGSGVEFGRVVEAFGWEEMSYFGFIGRKKVDGDRVFTANEAPVDKPIGFHHEMSTVVFSCLYYGFVWLQLLSKKASFFEHLKKIKEYPSKIFFFCAQPSPKGGETSIVPAHVILEKMEENIPEFVSKLWRLGYIFQTKSAKEDEKSNVICKTWKCIFKTEDKLEAEKRAKEKLGCTSVRFNDDGSANFIYGPLDPIKEFGEKRVWFHHLVGRNEGDTDIYFGDGTPIPKSALEIYKKIIDENCVDIKWQKGDILLVDNLRAQHARRAGEAPRQIFVSICK